MSAEDEARLRDENELLRRKLSDAFDEAVRTDQALQSLRRRAESISSKLATVEELAGELQAENAQLRAQVADYQERVAELEERR